MTYTTLRQGSAGNEVKELQAALGFTGKDVDGIYGQKTAQAVRDYQTANGLQIDGIAGNETLGHLYGTAQNQAQPQTQAQAPAQTAAPVTDVPSAESEAVAQAQALLEEHLGRRPVDYNEEWARQQKSAYDEYANREEFSYDVNEDALYQQLQDQYIQSGRMAMMDTMGQAAAMTGGYGSSYGQMVGQQAYQSHLQQLTDKIPELYQLARENYDAEGQALLERFALLGEMDDREYSRYMNELNSWMNEREYLTGRLDTAKGYAYQAKQDKLAQEQWERSFGLEEKNSAYDRLAGLVSTTGYTPSQQELEAAGMSAGEAAAYGKYYSDQSKASSSGGTKTYMNVTNYKTWKDMFADAESPAEAEYLYKAMLQSGMPEESAWDLYCNTRELLEGGA